MSGEERHRYSVAWLDLLAEGAKMGRAIVSRADPLPADGVTPAIRRRRAAGAAVSGHAHARPGVGGSPWLSRCPPAPVERARVQRAALVGGAPSRARPPTRARALLLPLGCRRRVEQALRLCWPDPVPVRDPDRRRGRSRALLPPHSDTSPAGLPCGVQALGSGIRRTALVSAGRLDARAGHPGGRAGSALGARASSTSWSRGPAGGSI